MTNAKSATETPSQWKAFHHGVLYEGGFPLEWIDRLRSEAFNENYRAFQRNEKHLVQLADDALTEIRMCVRTTAQRDPSNLNALSRVRESIKKRRFIDISALSTEPYLNRMCTISKTWNEKIAQSEADIRALNESFTSGTEEASSNLSALLNELTVRESILTTSPHFYFTRLGQGSLHAEKGLATYKSETRSERRLLTKLYLYLQRGATKTHVASSLGKVGFVNADHSLKQPLRIIRGKHKHASPGHTFLSYWAVSEMSKCAFSNFELAGELVPLLLGCVQFDDLKVATNLVTGQRVELAPEATHVLRHTDGTKSVKDIAALTANTCEETWRTLNKLAELNILDLGTTPPVTEHDPIQWLLDRIGRQSNSGLKAFWWEKIHAIIDAAHRIEIAENLSSKENAIRHIERLFTGITNLPSRRNPGKTYGDRLVFYEERQANLSCTMGTPFLERLSTQVGAALEICWAYGVLWKRHYQSMANAAFCEASQSDAPVSFMSFVSQLQKLGRAGHFRETSCEMDRFLDRWNRLVHSRAGEDNGIAKLNKKDVHDLLSDFELNDCSAHAGIDIFVDASDEESLQRGDFRLTIGEVGENVMGWGSQFYFHDDHKQVLDDLNKLFQSLPDYRQMVMILPERTHKGLVHQSFSKSGKFIFANARSNSVPGEDLPLRDLFVFREHGALNIGTMSGQRFQMFHHHDELVHLWAFAPPRICLPPIRPNEGYAPRVQVENVCMIRAQAWLPSSIVTTFFGTDAQLLAHIRQFLSQRRIGERIFVHVPSEPKPIFLDLASPLVIPIIKSLAQHGGDFRVVEMCPPRDAIWNHQPESGSRVLEMRLLMARVQTSPRN